MVSFTPDVDGSVISIRTKDGFRRKGVPYQETYMFVPGLTRAQFMNHESSRESPACIMSIVTHKARRLLWTARFVQELAAGEEIRVPSDESGILVMVMAKSG
jgi:hypothetical protein